MTNQPLPPVRPLESRPRAIVIGASSGIGAALVEELARQGYVVAALARREAKLQDLQARVARTVSGSNILIYPHNTVDFDAIPALFQEIVGDLGGLDLVIYNAGVMPAVAADEFSFAKDRQMLETNLLGAVAWLDQAALRFSRARAGHIVGISSVAGDRGRVGNPAYHASKGGLSIFLESLRNRLSKAGVTVTTIKPGFVKTGMLDNAPRTFWVITPEEAAAEIVHAVRSKQQTRYVPARWALVMLIIRHIPSFVFRRIAV